MLAAANLGAAQTAEPKNNAVVACSDAVELVMDVENALTERGSSSHGELLGPGPSHSPNGDGENAVD